MGAVDEPLSAAVYTGDFVCKLSATADADEDDQNTADQLIAAACRVDPMTGFAMAVEPGHTLTVAMAFETDDQAKRNADSRAQLAAGPAPGQGGAFTDRFKLGPVTADGRVVSMELSWSTTARSVRPVDRPGGPLSRPASQRWPTAKLSEPSCCTAVLSLPAPRYAASRSAADGLTQPPRRPGDDSTPPVEVAAESRPRWLRCEGVPMPQPRSLPRSAAPITSQPRVARLRGSAVTASPQPPRRPVTASMPLLRRPTVAPPARRRSHALALEASRRTAGTRSPPSPWLRGFEARPRTGPTPQPPP